MYSVEDGPVGQLEVEATEVLTVEACIVLKPNGDCKLLRSLAGLRVLRVDHHWRPTASHDELTYPLRCSALATEDYQAGDDQGDVREVESWSHVILQGKVGPEAAGVWSCDIFSRRPKGPTNRKRPRQDSNLPARRPGLAPLAVARYLIESSPAASIGVSRLVGAVCEKH